MSRREILVSIGVVVVVGVGGLTAPAYADSADNNGHNRAGAIVSSVAAPGSGVAVAGAAQEQAVDNFGFANCADTPRNNS